MRRGLRHACALLGVWGVALFGCGAFRRPCAGGATLLTRRAAREEVAERTIVFADDDFSAEVPSGWSLRVERRRDGESDERRLQMSSVVHPSARMMLRVTAVGNPARSTWIARWRAEQEHVGKRPVVSHDGPVACVQAVHEDGSVEAACLLEVEDGLVEASIAPVAPLTFGAIGGRNRLVRLVLSVSAARIGAHALP